MNLVEFPSAHSRIEHLDSAGFPVVTIILPGGELWQTWADYRQRFKIGAQRTHARHVGSLIEFLAAKAHEFHHLEARGRLIQAWADALVMGTVGEDGNDPSGLFWLPMSYSEARKTVQSVTAFGDFLAERGIAPPLNPERVATVAEQIVFWRAWSFKKGASLLGHLRSAVDSRGRSYVAREVSIRKTAHHGGADDLKRFPNDLIVSLLKDGFSARPPHLRWTVWRDQMITLLMHYGGRRVSEPLHMWVGDVEPNSTDPTRCIPWIHHPSEGYIEHVDPRTGTAKRLRRDVYLRLVHGIRPLNLRTARRRVGFKQPMLTTDMKLRVFWSDAEADRLFWQLYNSYLAARPRVSRHPFLFITPDGDPMTPAAFTKVHAAAARRIGLVPAKHLGTTPHGHRHEYASAAAGRNVTPKILQVALAHRALSSQEPYKNPYLDEIAEAMCTGAERRLSILRQDTQI